MVNEDLLDWVLQRIVLVYRILFEVGLLEAKVQLGNQLILLVFLENLGVVFESAENILYLDTPSRVRCKIETFNVGFELAED